MSVLVVPNGAQQAIGTPRLRGNPQSWGYFTADAEEVAARPGKKDEWKQIQLTTFTNWANDRLSGSKPNYSGPVITDLQRDLQDGVIIVKLLENLSSKRIRGFVKSPGIAAQKIANLHLAFELMKSEGVKHTGIGEFCTHFSGTIRIILTLIIRNTGSILNLALLASKH